MTLKLLLVDDNSDLIESMAVLMEEDKVDIECIYSLNAARRALQNHTPDLVYLDIKLPDGNGLELYRDLQLQQNKPEVVMMTGFRLDQVLSETTRDRLRVFRFMDYDDNLAATIADMKASEVVLLMDHYDDLHQLMDEVGEVSKTNVARVKNLDDFANQDLAAARFILVESDVSLMHGYSLIMELRALGYKQSVCLYISRSDVPDTFRHKSIKYLGCILKPYDPVKFLEDLEDRIETLSRKKEGEVAA